MCWNFRKESPIIIHHIEEHAKTHDDSYENLALLCLEHHAIAHSKWLISQHPCPPDLIRSRKAQWIRAVADFKSGLRPAPGTERSLPAYQSVVAPAPPSHFTGRREDRNQLATMLLSRQRVALHGMGGVGKTATARQLAAELMPQFPGGIFWASLAESEGDPRPILRVWFHLCGRAVPEAFDLDSLAHIARGFLVERQADIGALLVVIDDVRQTWLEAAQLLMQIVPGDTPLLVTTRDEMLAAALTTIPHPLGAMLPNEAMELLTAHAGSQLPAAEPDAALALLDTIGYLPLAIELAGKQLAFSSRKPGFHLEDFFRTIQRHAVESLDITGHRGVSATFAVTYESLQNHEQSLFRWLGVFAGSTIQAASVSRITGIDRVRVDEILDGLVARSFLNWGRIIGSYALHPLLRQYAQFLLAHERSGFEAQEAAQRHLACYLALAESNAQPEPHAYDELEAALPELLAAINFASTEGEHEAVIKFTSVLWRDSKFLSTKGYYREAISVIEKAVFACRALGRRLDESIHLGNLGTACSHLGLPEQALENYHLALAICREINDRYNEGAHLGNLGLLYGELGQVDLAIKCYEQALEIGLETGNLDVVANQLGCLGGAYRRRDSAVAQKYYEKALEVSRMLGDRLGEGNSLSNLGLICFDLEQMDKAAEYIQSALDISRLIGDRKGEANRLGHLGNICLKNGLIEQAVTYFEQAVEINRKIGYRFNEGNWLGSLGTAHRYLQHMDQAISYYEHALKISREIKHLDGERIWLTNLGITYRDLGRWPEAIDCLEQALIISNRMSDKSAEIVCLDNLARICQYSNQLVQAMRYHEQVLVFHREMDDTCGVWTRLEAMGACYTAMGDSGGAATCYEQALSLSRKLGDRSLESKSLYNLGCYYRAFWQLEKAIHYFTQALTVCHALSDRVGEGIVSRDLGVALIFAGQPQGAIDCLQQSLMITLDTNNRPGEALVRGNLGNAYRILGNLEQAVQYHEQARIITLELGDQANEANWQGALADDYHAQDRPELAVISYRHALQISRDAGIPGLEGRCLEGLGAILFDQGQIEQAAIHFEAALVIARKLNDRLMESNCLRLLGMSHESMGSAELAKQHFEQALLMSREVGDRRGEAATCWSLGLFHENSDLEYAARLISVAVAYERELNTPEAEDYERRLKSIRKRLRENRSKS